MLHISINGRHLEVELSTTNEARSRGLMYRDYMDPDSGMLFIFPDVDYRSFWMENTQLPLSIAYLNEDGVILNIEEMAPFSRSSVKSSGPAAYALEVNAGWFSRNHIRSGDRVDGIPQSGVIVESLLREYIGELLKEDPMGFVQDLAAASDEFGEETARTGGMFFGGNPGKGGGKAIKRAFNANADHAWLATLNTVHWKDPYILDQLQDSSKDELSTSMSLPGDRLLKSQFGDVGLWIKGRITLATNDQDNLYSGNEQDYKPKTGLDPDEKDMEALRKYLHRKDSSGINKLPQVSKDYSRYGNLKPGDPYAEELARRTPYVLDQSTWDPDQTYSSTNEALVDNWKAVGIVAGTDDLVKSVKAVADRDWGREAIGVTRKIFTLARDYGVPIYDVNRNMLWSPE